MDAVPQQLLGEQREPALDQIDPGCALRREVPLIAGTLRQPPPDQCGLVGRVVVHDEMHVQGLGDGYVERREERGGSVAQVVVGAPRDLARPHGQPRLAAIQHLDLRRFGRAPDLPGDRRDRCPLCDVLVMRRQDFDRMLVAMPAFAWGDLGDRHDAGKPALT
jgi:hypothetical protein